MRVLGDKALDLRHQYAAVGVRIRHREDQLGVLEACKGCEQLVHLIGRGHRVERCRAEGDEEVAPGKSETEARFLLCPPEKLQTLDAVDTEAADEKNRFRLFAELNDAP